MNITLWVFQVLLALHTLMGAFWKFSNSTQAVPSLAAIPHGVWIGLSVLEILAAIGLLVPVIHRPFAIAVPVGAAVIALEMVIFSAIHLWSGEPNRSPIVYWLVVAAICGFVAYGRWKLRPL